jgi:hypothetical protein
VVPAGYEELARLYGDDIRRSVRRCLSWARPDDRDNVVQYILKQFLERDVIALYRPDYVSDRTRARVSFRSFILGQVPTYCRGQGEALARHYGRELCIADVLVGDGRSTWIEGVADVRTGGWDDYPSLDDDEVLQRLRAHLAGRPPREGQLGLLELFDDLAARTADGKPVTEAGLRRRFRMDEETAAARLAELRAELRSAVVRPDIDLGPVKLPAARVMLAARVLREASGNQVVKVWERAGLAELAGLGKTWYLAPAKKELDLFPLLRGARGGHYEGGHGSPVKRGLIHWLERLAAGREVPSPPPAPPPAAEPEETWLDRAEAVLWGVPGATPEKVDEVLEMARKVFS